MNTPAFPDDWSLCVAPMLDWTDRHCRYLHRLLAPKARLYTEMITTGALLHGEPARHLDFDAAEHPVALQVGGSEPADLAHAARLAAQWGYDEINLNCGCPSERVQKGAFGACLMAEPQLVADCVKAMQDASPVPVTVKHRIGLDYNESYDFVRDFVGTIHETGCEVFVVHARNAVLKGLSPKENRDIPPLRYGVVRQLQVDFPQARFILNGGISSAEQALVELRTIRYDGAEAIENVAMGGINNAGSQVNDVDSASEASGNNAGSSFEHPPLAGVMLGREAWYRPRVLSEISRQLWPDIPLLSDAQVVEAMHQYAIQQVQQGVPLRMIAKPMLALTNGLKGARRWRQLLSDAKALADNNPDLLLQAWQAIRSS